MKRYKVIALSVKGIGSKIYDSGDIVNESNFNEDHPDILVKKGFLMELNAEVETPAAEAPAAEVPAAEAPAAEIPAAEIPAGSSEQANDSKKQNKKSGK